MLRSPPPSLSLTTTHPKLLPTSTPLLLSPSRSLRFPRLSALGGAMGSVAADSGGRRWDGEEGEGGEVRVGVGTASAPVRVWGFQVGLADRAFFLFTIVACTTTIAFTSLIVAAIPTLHAMRKTAISLAKLADTVREELPSTMAVVRLSGMEISDLTLELSDLSQEITDGVAKSAQAVQAVEAGIRKIGALARHKTMTMIEERANLPPISLRPVVTGAARKTSNAVGEARKAIARIFSQGESDSDSDSESLVDGGESINLEQDSFDPTL